MTTDTIKALRDALTGILEITTLREDVPTSMRRKNVLAAQDALALTADASEDAPADENELYGAAMKAARKWASAEYADARNRGAGGPGKNDDVSAAEDAFRTALDAMFDAARPAPVAATPAPERVPARTEDELRHMLWSSTIAGSSVTLNHIEAGQFLALLKAAALAAPIAEVTAEKHDFQRCADLITKTRWVECCKCGARPNSYEGRAQCRQPATEHAKPGIYWYPVTPVGFHQVFGSTIDEAVDSLIDAMANEKFDEKGPK